MASRKSIMRFVILLIYVFNASAIPSKQFSCPDVCDCYLSRINWVADCTNKNLTYIPHDGLDLDTYILNMNDNFLSELEYFQPSNKIWTLQLSNNLLTEIKNSTFEGLRRLLNLDLSNNLISYIEPLALNDSKGLITIDLHGNQLKPVHNSFLFSTSLRNLNLANCRLTEISSDFFVNIRNLNTLDLSGNFFDKLKPRMFNPLKNLKHLNLNDCNITYVSIQAFHGLEDLSRLELAQNKFTSDVDWQFVLRYSRLEHLDLRRSGITKLEIDAFANSTFLRSLVLAENKLSELNVGVTLGENLVHLDFLDLSNCDLKVPISGNAFTHATKLRTLILTGNRLISTDLSTVLSPLVKLTKLSLRDGGLNTLTANTFNQLTYLKELDISRNPSSINNSTLIYLNILKSLEHLDISYNDLEELDALFFTRMSNLKTLILTGNKLIFLEKGLFENIKNLQVLELNNCGLTSLNNILFFDDFSYYPNLEELRISGNPIQTLEGNPIFPFNMTNLNHLDMSKCNMSHLPKEYFVSTPNLKQLLLNNNNLKGDKNNMTFMERLTNIEELNLSFNDMTSIDPSVFVHNKQLMTLKLIGNPWICDCYVVDMWNWAALNKGIIDVLDGSTRIYSYIHDMKTKYLTCDYDSEITPIMKPRTQSTLASKRGFKVSFTWQRYVRDAICPPVNITVAA